jgi:hypothetical protein
MKASPSVFLGIAASCVVVATLAMRQSGLETRAWELRAKVQAARATVPPMVKKSQDNLPAATTSPVVERVPVGGISREPDQRLGELTVVLDRQKGVTEDLRKRLNTRAGQQTIMQVRESMRRVVAEGETRRSMRGTNQAQMLYLRLISPEHQEEPPELNRSRGAR